jgi:hypothetical protein
MNQGDMIEGLTRLVVNLHIFDASDSSAGGGMARRLRYAFGGPDDGLGKVAKACGTTPEIVMAWESGTITPTTPEALRWLTYLQSSRQRLPARVVVAQKQREEAARDLAQWRAAAPTVLEVDVSGLTQEQRDQLAQRIRRPGVRPGGAPRPELDKVQAELASAVMAGGQVRVDVGAVRQPWRELFANVLKSAAARYPSGMGMELVLAAWEEITWPGGKPAAGAARARPL